VVDNLQTKELCNFLESGGEGSILCGGFHVPARMVVNKNQAQSFHPQGGGEDLLWR